jgi:hypothetical protein
MVLLLLLLLMMMMMMMMPLPAGFGDSDKPLPSALVGPRGHFYNYDTWSQQIRDFVNEVSCASAAAVTAPHLCEACCSWTAQSSDTYCIMHFRVQIATTLLVTDRLYVLYALVLCYDQLQVVRALAVIVGNSSGAHAAQQAAVCNAPALCILR